MKPVKIITLLIIAVVPSISAAVNIDCSQTGTCTEIDFPEIGGIDPSRHRAFGPANWVNYIFIFGLAVVGLALIGSVVYAGLEYMTAGGSQDRVKDARDRIWKSLLGLVILLGSYIFLKTINPQLVNIQNPQIKFNIESNWRSFYLKLTTGVKLVGDECEKNIDCLSGKCQAKRCVANPELPGPQQ